MNKQGPIIVIDDDPEDRELFQLAFARTGYAHDLKLFNNGKAAIDYLTRPDVFPFMIISDITMPGLSGYAVRDYLFNNSTLRQKCIPFLFFSTSANEATVELAYQLPIQGIFEKPSTVPEFERRINLMLDYWQDSTLK